MVMLLGHTYRFVTFEQQYTTVAYIKQRYFEISMGHMLQLHGFYHLNAQHC